ncbi:3-oxoacyl-ACP reductase [Nocardioides sp. Root190]|uniref:SDR family NAD(P)-dependent oxidoreductase n=1 Tax=Nocardioides sp. Root190 TaxID=1736488 RepID=UPI0006FA4969|nr:SDR family NAD(P)-dependent oxidoreductase [Nocardioides sp. Root190]KRB76358.1 3-oxoacyl-ACP reductase [Nocardioides sp. Root190]
MSDLTGQWAVVTGASKGIGAGIARALVADGAHVLLVARNPDDLAAAATSLRADAGPGQEVRTEVADVADRAAVRRLLDVVAGLPSLNVFVANVGSGMLRPFLEVTEEDWDGILALNLTGTFLCVQGAARVMVDQPPGNKSIIVVSSIRGLGARPGVAPYAATKAGLNQLARVAAYELAPLGVRVNVLSPGITATPLSMDHNPDLLRERTEDVPMGRPGTPDDMARAAAYLAGPGSGFVTGTNLVVDGGESLW